VGHEPKQKVLSLALANQPAFRAKHAASIYYRGRLLATGTNKKKTHPMMQRFCKHPEAVWLHAEIDCIVKVVNHYGTEILRDCELYVARVTKDGAMANSQPCEGCQRAIDAFLISRVYYTTKEGWNVQN